MFVLTEIKNQLKRQKGFTLLELLVVIAIIGILVTLGTASYTTAQKKSRDARRKADMKAVQNGFEQYYAANDNVYATPCETMATADYLPAGLPVDPKNEGTYVYSFTCSTTSYCACALLESATSGNSGAGCSFSGTTHFCAKNLQ